MRLADRDRATGVHLLEEISSPHPVFHDSRCTGIRAGDGRAWCADLTLVAAGAWTPRLLPWLEPVLWATAQTVSHFQPADPLSFTPPEFPVWGADIGRTGWYGFSATGSGIVKVANHGPGRRVHADDPRRMPDGEEERYRSFLRETFPALAVAPVHSTRVCLYGDTFDGAFWIAHDPDHPGLAVAAGDSGHAFKFAPVLGGIIADVVERRANPWTDRYRWREPSDQNADGARAAG